MRHLRRELEETLNEAVALCEEVAPGAPVIQQRAKIQAALAAYQPALMFYGQYNAGKSTLLNALLGDGSGEIAATSDRPCTSAVHEYRLGDFIVYDTPGIDAPQEHERISKAQLEQAHVVVFVVSTGGSFDERASIEALAEIYRSGRPLIIALNNKGSVEDAGAPQVTGIREKLLSNLAQATGDARVREKVEVVLVNALTGVRARERMRAPDEKTRTAGARLYERSAVGDLGDVMLAALMRVTGDEVLRPAVLMLAKVLQDSCDQLRAQLEGDERVSFLDVLYSAVSSLQREFVDACEAGIVAVRNELIEDLVSGLQGEKALKGISLDHYFDSYLEKVGEVVDQKVLRAQLALQELLSVAVNDVQADGGQPVIDMNAPFGMPGEGRSGSMSGLAVNFDQKKFAEGLRQFAESEAGTKLITKGLLQLRKLKIPGFKGRWERTLARWAGNIGKGLGVGIQIASVGYELHKAGAAQREYDAAMVQNAADLRVMAKNAATSAERQVLGQLPEWARSVFGQFEETIGGDRREAQATNDRQRRAITGLERLQDRLQAIVLAM